jgi:hydroxyethylthiazole kinase-like uncharacterized protein yjeF
MKALLTAKEMREIDYETIIKLRVSEQKLMELAGYECYKYIGRYFESQHQSLEGKHLLVVSGKGNNGGDGIVLTRHLINGGALVDLVHLCQENEIKENGLLSLKSLKQYLVHTNRLRIFEGDMAMPPMLNEMPYDGVVDAILGTGYSPSGDGRLKSPIRESVLYINKLSNTRQCPVFSVDIPSGLDGTTGRVVDIAINADLTISLGFLNSGLYLEDGPEHCGQVVQADISLPPFLIQDTHAKLLDEAFVSANLPKRQRQHAKHQNGKVLVITGSQTRHNSMMGAALLALHGALISGAGYVCASVPPETFNTVHMSAPEAIVIDQRPEQIKTRLEWADTVLIGPGLGRDVTRQTFILDLLKEPVLKSKSVVLDADALFALAQSDDWQKLLPDQAILTPHIQEFSRLLVTDIENISYNRLGSVRAFAQNSRTTLLLKGTPTIVADSNQCFISNNGTQALASAGTGDVLSGIVAAMAAQGLAPLYAAGIGAFIHGLAGKLSGESPNRTSATSVLDGLAEAYTRLET